MNSRILSNISLFLLAGAIFAGCESGNESISGKYTYTVLAEGDGPTVKNGEYIIAGLKVIDSNDSLWIERDARELPVSIIKDSTQWSSGLDGVNEIFYYAKKGDSLAVTLTVEDFFTNTARMAVPPNAVGIETITMYWKVAEIFNYEDYYNYMVALEEENMRRQAEKEKEVIESFISENNWETAGLSPGGVRVIIHEPGEGANAEPGQRVVVNYSGFYLNGLLFDSNVESILKEHNRHIEGREYSSLSFVIDNDAIIEGWHQGFKLLNKGAKATFVIPSSLGYGPRGFQDIPPNTVLRFDVELLDVQ